MLFLFEANDVCIRCDFCLLFSVSFRCYSMGYPRGILGHDLDSFEYKQFNLDDCWSDDRHPQGNQYSDLAHFASVC